jgi:hypothetical protein
LRLLGLTFCSTLNFCFMSKLFVLRATFSIVLLYIWAIFPRVRSNFLLEQAAVFSQFL